MKKKIYTSPYKEPQPFSKHCYREEEKLAIQLRRKYLYKCKLKKAFEEEEKRIELELVVYTL